MFRCKFILPPKTEVLMTPKALWQLIKDVVEWDKDIRTIQAEIDAVSKGIQKGQTAISQKEADLQNKKQAFFTAQKTAQLTELNLDTVKDAEKQKRDRLESVKNQ